MEQAQRQERGSATTLLLSLGVNVAEDPVPTMLPAIYQLVQWMDSGAAGLHGNHVPNLVERAFDSDSGVVTAHPPQMVGQVVKDLPSKR